jgi:hypothetical protein
MLRAQERLLVLTVLSKEEQTWAGETRRTPSSQHGDSGPEDGDYCVYSGIT